MMMLLLIIVIIIMLVVILGIAVHARVLLLMIIMCAIIGELLFVQHVVGIGGIVVLAAQQRASTANKLRFTLNRRPSAFRLLNGRRLLNVQRPSSVRGRKKPRQPLYFLLRRITL
jgi:hypothetical protein